MSEQIDILNIDIKIRENFNKEFEKLPLYKERLNQLENSLDNHNLDQRIKKNIEKSYNDLNIYIKELETQTQYNFYIINTSSLIEEYKLILNQPIKISFLGKKSNKTNKKKQKIINNFLELSSDYIDINFIKTNISENISCTNCRNKKDFDIINKNIYICNNCYAQQNIIKHNSSYNDIDRINISSKYMYDRKIHFRDCIKQYQGKQNSTIPSKVYKNLEKQFNRHHLLEGDEKTPKNIRFHNITKNHIMIFLKELGYSNHYENVHLIHYNFTDIKPDDISHIEDQLLDDFDILTDLYDKMFKHINRKNFINTQYVLYQLLRRHKYKCKKEEFIILKTIDRKFFHDEVCKKLFEQLNWNHTPFY